MSRVDFPLVFARVEIEKIIMIKGNLNVFTFAECALALFCCVLIMCYFPAKPPKPPSISAHTQRGDFISGAFKLARYAEDLFTCQK